MLAFTRSILAAVLCLGVSTGGALAAGGGGTAAKKQDSNYTEAVKAVKARNYQKAIPLLRASLKSDPANADAHNYLGYSLRKTSNIEDALVSYNKALSIDPAHKGANEYLGELYLEMGQLDKAKERLAALDKACFFGCEEHRELKAEIEEYVAKNGG